ncbi:hypothetical protein EB796_002245 [Bugula neritina]|uniref:Uncharacterized protein n=1 Tax=Bugula neritina TaxID=10212 RepID=A0A7J7KMU1_BUGNE|nr:hypothetical protein EB796_002245 [Bugula neritina]
MERQVHQVSALGTTLHSVPCASIYSASDGYKIISAINSLRMAELSGWLRILVTSLILVSCVYADGLQQIQSGILDVVEPVISEENDIRPGCVLAAADFMDRIRMEGDSGIMQVRNVFDHTKAWGTNTGPTRHRLCFQHCNLVYYVDAGTYLLVT